MEVLTFAAILLVVFALAALEAAAETRDGFTCLRADPGRSIGR